MRALTYRGLLALTIACAATPAVATDVVIRDFVGTVSITQGDVDVPLIANDMDGLRVTNRDDVITIDGGHDRPSDTKVCQYGGGGFTMNVNGRTWFGKRKKADRAFAEYPVIDVTVPEGTSLSVGNSIVELSVEPLLASAQLALGGCRDVRLGDVLDADIRKSGSSELYLGDVGSLNLRKSGAGETEIGEIGTARIELSGAGDLDIDRVGKSLELRRSGASNIEIDEIVGSFDYRASGAGNMSVDSGEITRLLIDKSGAGRIEIDADIVDAVIDASGAGSIELGEVSGSYSEDLSGAVKVRRD